MRDRPLIPEHIPTTFAISRLPSPKRREQVVREVAKEFETFLVKEFIKNSFQTSGEMSEKYGYFYREIILEALSRGLSVGVEDFLRRAIENQLEATERGYIKQSLKRSSVRSPSGTDFIQDSQNKDR